MSNFPDAHKVYELAAVFRERVIEQGRSFLWPDQEIWTEENVNRLLSLEKGLGEDGSYPPLTELYAYIDDLPTELRMIAADAQAACHFFWNASEPTFRRLMDGFLSRQGLPPVDSGTWESLVEQCQFEIPGSWMTYASPGTLWHVSALMTLATLVGLGDKPATVETIEPAIRLAFAHDAGVWLHYAWTVLHALYPDEFVSMPSETLRAKIIRRYGKEAGISPEDGEFISLKKIRAYLRSRLNQEWFDFHDAEFFLEWETSASDIRKWYTHRRGGPAQVFPDSLQSAPSQIKSLSAEDRALAPGTPYEVAALFEKSVLNNDRSLLWPGDPVWTTDVMEDFLTRFQRMPVNMGETWLEVYENEFGAHADDVTKLLADSYAFLMQFPSVDTVEGSIKERTLQAVLARITDASPDPVVLAKVTEGFHVGVGDPGTDFLNAVQIQVAYVPAFVQAHRADPELGLEVAADKAQRIIAEMFGFSQTVDPVRNIILHLFEPGSYEPIASQDHKETIVEKFQDQLGLGFDDEATDTDLKIRSIRRALEHGYFDPGFDFYDEAVKPYWLGNNRLDGEGGTALSGPTIADLAAETYLDPGFLGQVERLLAEKKQLIFEGPPGSGKTFVAEKFARYFTGQPLTGADRNEQIELVQFHQSYSYEDFVEGIRPRTNEDGQLVYDIEKGIFRRFAETAEANPDKRFVLIIDEVNRGNLSRILGELMLLLEYRNQSSTLPYSKDKLQIPENLYIIGTMNSADRSLSQIDYALRRRFFFVRFMSVEQERAPVLEGWLKPRTSEWERVVSLFIALNAQLRSHLATDDLQVGHSYFMRHDIHKRSVQDEVWQYAVMPLLREYLYHHRDRDTMLQQYQIDSLMQQSVSEESLIAETDPDDV